jgi:hypothetical protein
MESKPPGRLYRDPTGQHDASFETLACDGVNVVCFGPLIGFAATGVYPSSRVRLGYRLMAGGIRISVGGPRRLSQRRSVRPPRAAAGALVAARGTPFFASAGRAERCALLVADLSMLSCVGVRRPRTQMEQHIAHA